MEAENSLRVLVDNPRDTEGWRDLEQIRRQSLVHPSQSLVPVRLSRHVPDAGIGGWVHDRALSLESRAKDVQGVDHSGAKST